MVKKFRAKFRMGVGKMRRFAIGRLRRRNVHRQAAIRQGECKRCGVCCKLLFQCPFLQDLPDGGTRCRIHNTRPRNCRIFPISEKDLHERDLLCPHLPCGYSFEPTSRDAPAQSEPTRFPRQIP